MRTRYLLDSNFIISYLQGARRALVFAGGLIGAELYASVITEMEILSYHLITVGQERGARLFLDQVTIVPLDEKVKSVAIALRRGTRLKLPDAVVAAAVVVDAVLVTSDHRLGEQGWPGLRTLNPS
jgi:predicted nucleic acid-binding protein